MKEQQGKVCNKCKQWKPLEEFNKNKNYKDGRRYDCRECQKERKKQWSKNNPNYNKQWRENNPEYFKIYSNSEQQKQYREVNKEKKKEYDKQYRKDNAERIKGRHKQYYKDNAEYHKQYYKDNAEYRKQYYKQYRKDNVERIKEQHKQWRLNNAENNLQYISSIVEPIRPIFKELNLPVYGYIYKFENIKTGHVYIGQTIRPLDKRYGSNAIKSWIKDRKKFKNQKFIDELIEEDIIVTEVLDVAFCKWHLNAIESYWIAKYDSYNNGYNNNIGHHKDDEGFEEFIEILEQHNLEFIDGQIVKN